MSKYHTTKVYGKSTGPLGFPMLDDVSQSLDALLNSLDSECKRLVDEHDGAIRVAKAAKIDIDLETRTEVSTVTTETVDRDNEVILAAGLNWKHWSKNPVVTFAHRYDQLPAGRGKWARKLDGGDKAVGRGYVAKTEYLEKPEGWTGDWAADAYWHYVKEGYMPGKSIGFIPTEVRPPSEKEIRARPELASVGAVIAKAEVIEYALAPVQSNRDAIVAAVGKTFRPPDYVLDEFGIVIPENEVPEQIVKQQEQVAPELVERLTPQPSVWRKSELMRILAKATSGVKVDPKEAFTVALEAHKGRI